MEDANVKLPKQVQDQKDKADKLWKEQHGESDPPVEPLQEPSQDLSMEPVVETLDPQPDPSPEPQPEPPADAEVVDYQHKFDVLQGKYGAEVPRLIAENRDLRGHSNELGQIIGTLQAEVEKLKVENKLPEHPPKIEANKIAQECLSDGELEELRATVDPEILGKIISGAIQNQIQPLTQSMMDVQGAQVRTVEDRFWDKIEATIPNWNVIDKSPEFNNWLDQKAPYTGMTRRQILQKAQSNLNAAIVTEIFNDFVASKGPAPEVIPPKAEKLGAPKPHISPAKGAGASNVPVQKKTWTVTQINKFYTDVQKGKYRNRDKDRKQTEQDIWNAQKEGRVQRE